VSIASRRTPQFLPSRSCVKSGDAFSDITGTSSGKEWPLSRDRRSSRRLLSAKLSQEFG
jgi:hypothetical protein